MNEDVKKALDLAKAALKNADSDEARIEPGDELYELSKKVAIRLGLTSEGLAVKYYDRDGYAMVYDIGKRYERAVEKTV